MSVLHTVVAFVVALGILIWFHELGHYGVARAFGVRVLRFSVGFGKPLLSWRDRRGTEWGVAGIPLGGYVKMLDSREAPVPESEKPYAFDSQPPLVRIAIVAAGPLANFVLAILFYAWVAAIGVEEPLAFVDPPEASPAASVGIPSGAQIIAVNRTPADTWPQVRWAVLQAIADGQEAVTLTLRDPAAAAFAVALPLSPVELDPDRGDPLHQLGLVAARPPLPPVVGSVAPESPAAAIGLLPGDAIVALADSPITDWQTLAETVRRHPGETVAIEWLRGGERLRAEVTLEAVPERDGGRFGRLGVQARAPDRDMLVRRVVYGPTDALVYGWAKTLETATVTLKMIGKMLVGEASVKNLSGPLTIATVAGQSAELGWAHYLSFLALVSVSLAVLNLLPIPILDGGHLLYYSLEWLRGRPLSETAQNVGQRIGMALLLFLMGLALFNDFVRWLS
ncbi:RIP metalloprotease RseP [Hydrogenophilus thiooxidans]|uniref:RIP metalloprotease RseP n=1 Tax=Hydrogenophilus thiooxidans TaxID=2820326 RepID=UPI001C2432AD|nr:RIP metalloprotease RseP [Hydrogenophilus thiooxidans]